MKHFALITLLTLGTPAFAEMSAATRADLQVLAGASNAAILAGDFAEIVRMLPPKVLQLVAQQDSIDIETARQEVIKSFENSMDQLEIESQIVDFSAATFGVTPTGRNYAIFSVSSVARNPIGRFTSKQIYLAFQDEGTWYQVQVGFPFLADLLVRAYPEFSDVAFKRNVVLYRD